MDAYVTTQPFFNRLDGINISNINNSFIQLFYEIPAFDNLTGIPVVPDGCVDFVFEYDPMGNCNVYVVNTFFEKALFPISKNSEYFGVRFQPGVNFSRISIDEINSLTSVVVNTNGVNALKSVIRENNNTFREFKHKMAKCRSFNQRISEFSDLFNINYKINLNEAYDYCVFSDIRDYIINSKGIIDMTRLEDMSGFSGRYIEKTFNKYLGYSPKTFCNIVRFQYIINKIEANRDVNITDLIYTLGFCDQSYFIKFFKKYTGYTPLKYVKL